MKVLMIDPASGWKYGFPKPAPSGYHNMGDEELANWFEQEGLPEEEAVRATVHCRLYEVELENTKPPASA